MRIAIAAWEGRVAPVLDWARRVLVAEVENGRACERREYALQGADLWSRASELLDLRAEVLICGAISAPLENALTLGGVRVYGFVCGPIEEVLAAYLDGTLSSPRFAMPGAKHRAWRWGRVAGTPMTADVGGNQGHGGHLGGCSGARRGRRGGFGGGPPAECVCPSCGEKAPHVPGTRCRQIHCPKCGTPMVRGS